MWFDQKKNIEIVINQAAQGPLASYICVEACKKTKTPLISVVHNSPDALIKRLTNQHIFLKNILIRPIIEYILPWVIRWLPRYSSRRLVKYSNAVVLLSPEYIDKYERIYIGHHSEKIIAIPNPLTKLVPEIKESEKENIALFVGRLCEQKAVDRILKLWKCIEQKKTDAKLYIVGNGELEANLKQLANDLKLERVYFEGYKPPEPYYKRAKVFLMTSIYEGLPMTLLECQQYGVVPIVMDTFAAAHGILGNQLSQFLIPVSKETLFTEKVSELFENENLYRDASLHCIQNVTRFSVEIIGAELETLLNKCIKQPLVYKL